VIDELRGDALVAEVFLDLRCVRRIDGLLCDDGGRENGQERERPACGTKHQSSWGLDSKRRDVEIRSSGANR
jgi:hypothetical protein